MIKRLSGYNILVTGASRGIGRAIAEQAAREGASVAIGYSSSEESANKVLNSLEGSGHFCVKIDISNESSVKEAFELVLKNFNNELHGLVNNAGVTKDQILLRMKTEDFETVINTNLKGTFFCTREASKSMLKKKRGSIVHITSVIGQMGQSGQANYAASKAGIEAFSKSVAQELASRSIRSNCVAPGFIQTDMTDALNETQKEAIMKTIPMGEIGQGHDVAQAVCFLLSNESKYMTGQTLGVNGGLYMS